jgi:hypothetical protein
MVHFLKQHAEVLFALGEALGGVVVGFYLTVFAENRKEKQRARRLKAALDAEVKRNAVAVPPMLATGEKLRASAQAGLSSHRDHLPLNTFIFNTHFAELSTELSDEQRVLLIAIYENFAGLNEAMSRLIAIARNPARTAEDAFFLVSVDLDNYQRQADQFLRQYLG